MVKFRDLTKTLILRSIQLSAAENQLLLQRAAREMAERSLLGAIIVPLCLGCFHFRVCLFFAVYLQFIVCSYADQRCIALFLNRAYKTIFG